MSEAAVETETTTEPAKETEATLAEVAAEGKETAEKPVAKPEEPNKTGNPRVEKRIHRLTEKLREQDRVIAELQNRTATPAGPEIVEPKREQFQSDAEYVTALVDHKLNLRDVQARTETFKKTQASVESNWSKSLDKAHEKYEDLDDLISESPDHVLPGPVISALKASDVAGDLYHHLLKNHEEYERLAQMDPVSAVRFLGRLEAKFLEKPAAQKLSAAPPPIKPVGGNSNAGIVDPEKESPREYAARRNKEEFERKKGRL